MTRNSPDSLPAATPQGGETSEDRVLPWSEAHNYRLEDAAAPVEEGRETYRVVQAETGRWWLWRGVQREGGVEWETLREVEVVTASRAPHEGPTSGLREAAQRILAAWDRNDYIVRSLFDDLRAALAASPLAPTSDGALREAVERFLNVWRNHRVDGPEVYNAVFGVREAFLAASRPVVENTGETR